MSDTISTALDFQINSLNYINSAGQGIDLRKIFIELNIFEDLFSTVMSGNIVVTDSTNIFGYFSTEGNEFLVVNFDKPGLSNPINKTFRIYNRSKIVNDKPTNQTVRLDFCSEELLTSKSATFSKSYQNMLISDIIKDVAKTYLKIPTNRFSDNNIETTQGITNLVVPSMKPLQACNWLASKARSSYVGATYLFYENRDGYWFQSLQRLMDVSQPTRTYQYNVKNIDTNINLMDVASYEVIATPNTLDGLMTGKYSGILHTFDPLRGKFATGQLNADDLYNASVKLGTGKPYNNFQNTLQKTTADSYGGYKKFYPTNFGQNDSAQAPYIAGKQNVQPTGAENWLIERQAQLMQFLNVRVKMVVPGDPRLRVGDIIEFDLPSVEAENKTDPYYSGLYMISAIRHKIDIRSYECVLEICKDSLNTSVPGAGFSDLNSGIANV